MKREEARQLLQRYLEGNCTSFEAKVVESWLDLHGYANIEQWRDEEDALRTKEKIRSGVERAMAKKKGPLIRLLKPISIAASMLIVSIAGILFWTKSGDGEYLVVAEGIQDVVDPGTLSATLTLGDGSVIRLDNMAEDIILQDSGVKIAKNMEGELSYAYNDVSISRIDTNTVTIPVGGQYRIILPDGTKVSLNSASTLVYTTHFTGDTRTVKLQGEAYFEVTPNKRQPFIVIAGDTKTKVTGTGFNVSAYAEEDRTVTTLLEGEVYVQKEKSEVRLRPGEQSISVRGTSQILKKVADTESSIAWTKGYFSFDDQDIESVLRNIARWYDVDIYIQKKGNAGKMIGGTFSRSKSVEELLYYLDKLNVLKFKKAGRRVNVTL